LRAEGPLGDRSKHLDAPAVEGARALDERYPPLTCLEHGPEFSLVRESRNVSPEGVEQRRTIQRIGQRVPQGHQTFEILGTPTCLDRLGAGGCLQRVPRLTFAIFVKDDNRDQDGEAGEQVDAIAAFELADDVQQISKRLLKDQHRGRDETNGQDGVVAFDKPEPHA
jgi:hypothetical protein